MPAGKLQAELRSVGDLFGEADVRYEVAIYQRNYAWGQEQIEQLIEEGLGAATAGDDTYFHGNLVGAQRPRDSSSRHTMYEIIDGQQHLTTLYPCCQVLESTQKLVWPTSRDGVLRRHSLV